MINRKKPSKKTKSSRSSNVNRLKYKAAIEGMDIPPLTLDNKWHQLISSVGKTPTIDKLSARLNALIKKQGQLYNDIRDIRNVKKKLLDTIMNDMGNPFDDPDMDRKMDERGRLVDECTEKIELYQKEYNEIPVEIDELNYQLMLETMDLCYKKIREITEEIEDIDKWVEETRAELKKQLVIREEDATINHNLYTFMHDIFGSKVIDIFDIEYDASSKKVKLK